MNRHKRTIRLLSIAKDDLYEIVAYISHDKPATAEALLDILKTHILALQDHPFVGRVPDDTILAKLGYRYLVVENYLLFYTVQENGILVHRVVHGRRDYKDLL